jgi:hypothetical protein
MSVLVTGLALTLVAAQNLGALAADEELPPIAPAQDTSHYPRSEIALADGIVERIIRGLVQRLVAAAFLWVFGITQYYWYLHDRRSQNPRPGWGHGPLFFLANESPTDDWLGYALLAVAGASFLAVLIKPNRWTILVADIVLLCWVLPGLLQPDEGL